MENILVHFHYPFRKFSDKVGMSDEHIGRSFPFPCIFWHSEFGEGSRIYHIDMCKYENIETVHDINSCSIFLEYEKEKPFCVEPNYAEYFN